MLTVTAEHQISIHRYARDFPADAGFLALHRQDMRLPDDTRLVPAAQALA